MVRHAGSRACASPAGAPAARVASASPIRSAVAIAEPSQAAQIGDARACSGYRVKEEKRP